MFSNVAYLGKEGEDIVETDHPLWVTAVGYYRVHQSRVIRTERRFGRQDYQLIYVSEGKLHLRQDDKEHIIPKGHMLLFRPNDPQIYSFYSADKPEIYWVHFTGSEVEDILDRYEISKSENIFCVGSSPDYPWLFKHMIQELQLRRINYSNFLSLNLHHIFLMISRVKKEDAELNSDTLNEIENAIRFFGENYSSDISIENYAREHHMSACWFNRTFKRITTVTPMQYIIHLRIKNAIYLLNSTNYKIIQVANAVGYDDAYYFSRLFKKYIGVSPAAYKKHTKAL